MTWIDTVVPVTTLLVLFLPGAAVALLGGLRPGPAIAVAPVVTYGIVTVVATLAGFVALPWSPLGFTASVGAAAAVVVLLRAVSGRRQSLRQRLRLDVSGRPDRGVLVVVLGVLAGGFLSAGVLRTAFGRLDAPSQTWDYVFHANAVRLIADSGDVAPAALARINDWEAVTFYYPNSLHAVAAVVRDLTGAPVFAVLNGASMFVALLAGAGLAALLHRRGAPRAVTATTPLLLAGMASFPYDVLWRGPLLPFAVGVALIPAVLLLLDVLMDRRQPSVVVLFGLAAAGLLGLHPSTAIAAAIFVLVHLAVRWVRSPRALPRDLGLLVPAAAVALVAAVPAVQGALAVRGGSKEAAEGPGAIDWPAVGTPLEAIGDMLLLNHGSLHPQVWLAGLVVAGLLQLHRAGYMAAWLGGGALTFALFVAAASSDAALAETLTRPWWNDRWRLAAITVLALAPLAAHGLWSTARVAAWLLTLRRPRSADGTRPAPRRLVGALVAAGLALVVVGSTGLYAPSNVERMAQSYGDDRFISRDEVAAMRWLAGRSTGGRIMNDPNDGSAYLSAVAGLDPLFGHVLNPPRRPTKGETQQLLLEHFNCLDVDTEVRQVIEELDIRYVFVSDGYIRPLFRRVPGLRGIAESPSLTRVYQRAGVRIYEVDPTPVPTASVENCDRGDVPPAEGAGGAGPG